jgi:hypothetical protein
MHVPRNFEELSRNERTKAFFLHRDCRDFENILMATRYAYSELVTKYIFAQSPTVRVIRIQIVTIKIINKKYRALSKRYRSLKYVKTTLQNANENLIP